MGLPGENNVVEETTEQMQKLQVRGARQLRIAGFFRGGRSILFRAEK